ncbi:MAG TPA: hypothetical protein VJ022_07590, partial [Anaerolineales bacterium]|nr:hypothetical protein [Anaerolineales bacterium]
MKTKQLLIVLVLFVMLLPGCGAKETPMLTVPDGAQAGDLTGMIDCESQPKDSETEYAAECST